MIEGSLPASDISIVLHDGHFFVSGAIQACIVTKAFTSGGEGAELCDLLVVFENHILIFSDKDCDFPPGHDRDVAWSRWFKKAILKSAQQVGGAERWIRSFPERVYLDRKCRTRIPLPLPTGDQHLRPESQGGHPFAIGNIDPTRGFVHVFDEVSLGIVLSTLSTPEGAISCLWPSAWRLRRRGPYLRARRNAALWCDGSQSVRAFVASASS